MAVIPQEHLRKQINEARRPMFDEDLIVSISEYESHSLVPFRLRHCAVCERKQTDYLFFEVLATI